MHSHIIKHCHFIKDLFHDCLVPEWLLNLRRICKKQKMLICNWFTVVSNILIVSVQSEKNIKQALNVSIKYDANITHLKNKINLIWHSQTIIITYQMTSTVYSFRNIPLKIHIQYIYICTNILFKKHIQLTHNKQN